jgi:hypothetical protein
MDTVTRHSPLALAELDYREADGISVSLVWNRNDGALTLLVEDTRAGTSFELAVAAREARDAFQHPFAYAAFRGITVPDGALEQPNDVLALDAAGSAREA